MTADAPSGRHALILHRAASTDRSMRSCAFRALCETTGFQALTALGQRKVEAGMARDLMDQRWKQGVSAKGAEQLDQDNDGIGTNGNNNGRLPGSQCTRE
ncbi:MAG: hypothetical protein M1826_003327 [Phylliscum demangeonii]|nr:MAG: hypothetical protein M1826_003327 [Phylliscum demangeonii]